MKKTISVILSAALTLGLLTGCGGKEPSTESASQSVSGSRSEPGTAAALGQLASFSAGTLDGGSFTQEDIAARDITVLNFWSLDCGPCIAEMPELAEFAGALPDHVQLVTVCLDGAGSEDLVNQVLDQAGFEGVTIVSGDGDLGNLVGNIRYTPTTVLADSEGALVGDAIIGGQKDLSGTLLSAVNAGLKAGGKAEISLEG